MFAAIATLSGCQRIDQRPATEQEARSVIITLREGGTVKSSMPDDFEEQIRDFTLYIFDPFGNLADCVGSTGTSVEVKLLEGQDYNVYALANISSCPKDITDEETFIKTICNISLKDMKDTGVPMCGSSVLTAEDIVSGSGSVELTRLICRIGFTLDTSGLKSSEITVKSVQLRQTAIGAAPFCGPFMADDESVEDIGDVSDSEDIDTVNSGGTIWLYALENCQGVLLPGNTDPWMKIPIKISEKSSSCTYLEVKAAYEGILEGVPVQSENVTYRFYLGKDNSSDFSIERNRNISVTLKVTDMGVFDDSWKIEYGNPLPIVSGILSLTPETATIDVGETLPVTAVLTKTVDGVPGTVTEITDKASWQVTDGSIASAEKGKVTGLSSGATDIQVAYDGFQSTLQLTVKDVITYGYRFIIDGYESVIAGNETTPYKIMYYTDKYVNGHLSTTGTSLKEYTGKVTWSISKGSEHGTISTQGVLSGTSKGDITINAGFTHEEKPYKISKNIEVTEPSTINPDSSWEEGGDINYN